VILKNGMPNFVIFLFSGLLLWNFFQTGVQAGTGVIVNNAGIVKKVSFPREILALASIGSASVFFFFQAIVMVIFMLALKAPPDWKLIPLLFLALAAVTVFAAALAVFLSAVNVYLRDTQHLVEVLLTAWFWACPIVYSYQRTISAQLHRHHLVWLYFLNPVTPLVMTFQRSSTTSASPRSPRPTTHSPCSSRRGRGRPTPWQMASSWPSALSC